jgi:hypothetical protein
MSLTPPEAPCAGFSRPSIVPQAIADARLQPLVSGSGRSARGHVTALAAGHRLLAVGSGSQAGDGMRTRSRLPVFFG